MGYGEIYNTTWWGVALDTARTAGTEPDFFGSQMKLLTSNQPELVTNGDFSNSFTNWISQGDSITIVDGAARINRITNTTFIQQNVLTSGKTYLVEFDVLNKPDNNGTFIVRLGSNNVYDVVTYEGTRFSKYITSNGVDFRIYSSSNSGVIYVDNVSVKVARLELDQIEAKKCLADWIHTTALQDLNN